VSRQQTKRSVAWHALRVGALTYVVKRQKHAFISVSIAVLRDNGDDTVMRRHRASHDIGRALASIVMLMGWRIVAVT
jgi:hypothetical protein